MSDGLRYCCCCCCKAEEACCPACVDEVVGGGLRREKLPEVFGRLGSTNSPSPCRLAAPSVLLKQSRASLREREARFVE